MENIFVQYGERIQELLLNKLNSEDKEKLLAEINNNELLKQFFEEEKAIFKRVNDSMDIEIYENIKNTSFNGSETKDDHTKSLMLKFLIFAVLLLTLIFLFKVIIPNEDVQELSKQYYAVNFSGNKSTDKNDPFELAEAILEGNQTEDFPKLRKALIKVEPQSENFQKSKYLLAHLNFKEQRYKEAILLFEDLSKMDEYQNESQWYLALGYLANGEKEKSKNVLNKIVNSPSIFSKKAENLLSDIN